MEIEEKKERLPRIDSNMELKAKLLPLCRLKQGEIWIDPIKGHKVGVLDATNTENIKRLTGEKKAKLLINDPPYNIIVGTKNTKNLFRIGISEYIEFSKEWITNCISIMGKDAHLYVWLGAAQNEGFQPLPDFMIMMREFNELESRSYITLRNQRGYGTQKNWMCARQELLYYTKGNPDFKVVYTDIPKQLKGYFKTIDGKRVDNIERGKSNCIRPGNVWIDIQQVFYRMEENVSGAYTQKPLKVIDRLIETSSNENDLVVDLFSHSGTTLLSSEYNNRICYTIDNDPIFAELTIRRLEHYRKTGKKGWQWANPFPEIDIKEFIC